MTRSPAKFIAVLFIACFLAWQFPQFHYLESVHKDNQVLHIEQITLSTNHLPEPLFYQQLNLPLNALTQQISSIDKQTHYLDDILQSVVHSFSYFMCESIDALSLLEQRNELVLFRHLKQLKLDYQLGPILIHLLLPIKIDSTASSLSFS